MMWLLAAFGFCFLTVVSADDYVIPTSPAATCSGTSPSAPNYKDPKSYGLVSSLVQVFVSMAMPCNGYITKWRFVVRNNTIVNGTHLAVFRRGTVDNTTLKYVGDTYLQLINLDYQSTQNGNTFAIMGTTVNPAAGSYPAWVELTLGIPIAVQKGDYVGLYYDSMDTAQIWLTVPYSSFPNSKSGIETYVFISDNNHLQDAGYSLNLAEAGKDYRDIALVAVVSPGGTIQAATKPTTITARTFRTMRTTTTAPAVYISTETAEPTTKRIRTRSTATATAAIQTRGTSRRRPTKRTTTQSPSYNS